MSKIKDYGPIYPRHIPKKAMKFDGSIGAKETAKMWLGKSFLNSNGISFVKEGEIRIGTLEEPHICRPGDYIVQGVNGEFYPCNPDIFEKNYKRV